MRNVKPFRHTKRLWLLALAVAALACSDAAGPDGEYCTLGDVLGACSNGDSAVYSGGAWRATVYTVTTTEYIPYRDRGVNCAQKVIHCVEKHCVFGGSAGSMTAAQAIQACRG